MRYLITFSCYGAHMHGEEGGSVDRFHHLPGTRLLEPNPQRALTAQGRMLHPPYLLDQASRASVISAIRAHCQHRNWLLLAAHARTTHVHVVVEAGVKPERVLTEFKSYASRELNRRNPADSTRKRWALHGSTRWLWKDADVQRAIRYVIEEQGEPMAVFVHE